MGINADIEVIVAEVDDMHLVRVARVRDLAGDRETGVLRSIDYSRRVRLEVAREVTRDRGRDN